MKRKLSFLFLSQLFCCAVANAQHSGGSSIPSDEGGEVIVGLILGGLLLLFVVSEVISIRKAKKNKANKPAAEPVVKAAAKPVGKKQSDEVYAAIAMAIYAETEEVHDVEETVLTIRPVARTYSPWSSKIYGLREIPKR